MICSSVHRDRFTRPSPSGRDRTSSSLIFGEHVSVFEGPHSADSAPTSSSRQSRQWDNLGHSQGVSA